MLGRRPVLTSFEFRRNTYQRSTGLEEFYQLYGNNGDHADDQHYLSESSSASITDPNYP